MRKISSLLAIWAVMIMAMPTFANTRLQDDLITIGKPGSTANKRIKLGSQEIRSNTATSKLEYTHDGVTYKPIGSGSGAGGSSGGINLIANESFEDPITTGWSNNGGTFTQESYLNGTETDAKFARFVATAAGQYFETPLITVPTNFSGGCQADFKKVSVSADDLFKLEILDSSSNVLSAANIKKSSWVKFPTIDTPCPTPGSQFRLRVTSLAVGTIDADYGYLGSNQNLVNISQAKLIGTLSYSQNSNCIWATSSTSYVSYTADSDCLTPTATGEVIAPSTKIPGFQLNHKPGTYYIVVNGFFYQSGPAGGAYYRLADGTTPGQSQTCYGVGGCPVISGHFTYTTSGTRTIQIQGAAETASQVASVYTSGANRDLSFSVYYYPADSETAVNTDQASWFIDANIGGANLNTGTTATTSYAELTNASLDLVVNTSKGSSQAEVPCSGTNPSTGLTCSAGNESLGISFTPPSSGVYEVCAKFSAGYISGGVNLVSPTFQLVETPNNAQTILQEGGQRTGLTISTNNTGSYSAIDNCGYFKFSDSSKKTIRLMFEQSGATGTEIYADRSASNGQRDIRFTVVPLLSAYNRPILTGDQVTTPGTSKPVFYTAEISTTCAITKQTGNWIQAGTLSSTSRCTNPVIAGTFSGAPICVCTALAATGYTVCAPHADDTTSNVHTQTGYSTTAENVKRKIMCFEYKP